MWVSVDGGVTWIEQKSSGIQNWVSIASSGDGQRLIAASNGGGYGVYIYYSIGNISNPFLLYTITAYK